jgi:hypothetical protein
LRTNTDAEPACKRPPEFVADPTAAQGVRPLCRT